ncbi:ABC transporter ATP-binding protein [Limimaricola cinnabarinus]|jgi:ABC-2 type transport system ATP-binding protein|uniref:ABC transporter ATP-binding protein n=1 Tax=Limimaricola cinnabarinus TaxID=1125964 RepID=UPI0005ECA2EC|nr:ABC transporter ATP-binding protein [Limimaricola cinnabarinus]
MSGLIVSGVSHAYGARRALETVSLRVPRGRFCALLGPNGAGKSTLFSLLTRLMTVQAGRIEVAGHDLFDAPRTALAEIGVVFQQTTLDLDLSVTENLRYFAALHGLSGREAARRIDAALDRLAMGERAHERARDLNGGHRRRAEIARALVHGPSVLLLDEPTVGLDAASRAAITAHVHDLAGEGGLTVLWATHLADEVAPGDQVVVLHRGRVIADAPAREIAPEGDLAARFLALTSEAA